MCPGKSWPPIFNLDAHGRLSGAGDARPESIASRLRRIRRNWTTFRTALQRLRPPPKCWSMKMRRCKVLVPPTTSTISSTWTSIGFDDSSWLAGQIGVGYDTAPTASTDYLTVYQYRRRQLDECFAAAQCGLYAVAVFARRIKIATHIAYIAIAIRRRLRRVFERNRSGAGEFHGNPRAQFLGLRQSHRLASSGLSNVQHHGFARQLGERQSTCCRSRD